MLERSLLLCGVDISIDGVFILTLVAMLMLIRLLGRHPAACVYGADGNVTGAVDNAVERVCG